MSITVPSEVLQASDDPALARWKEAASSWRSNDQIIRSRDLSEEVLAALQTASDAVDHRSFSRVVRAIASHRKGDFETRVPNLNAASEMIKAFITADWIDGWVYQRENDGHLHPYLVQDVKLDTANDGHKYLSIKMVANGVLDRSRDDGLGLRHVSIALTGEDVARKYVKDIFLDNKLQWETQELKDEYLASVERYRGILNEGFAGQYRFTGKAFNTTSWSATKVVRTNNKVVHDISRSQIPAMRDFSSTTLIKDKDDANIPIHTVLRVFDLPTHEYIWVNSVDLTEYEWDVHLRDKLVLPDSQRDLLDILTTDISTFTSDLIEGKSSGNVIMCKGKPGLGKTLSAEIYSEVVKRPLYSIHSGTLGTSAEEVRKNLERVFKQAKRWEAVLLLDEADVFVIERGASIQQNAIVAEFLRTLEYFDGLMFMTTNRANNIDDAILSRCAAIINYEAPGRHDAARVWNVLASNLDVKIKPEVLEGLLDGFPDIAPRDMKMLLRLALRVSKFHEESLSLDVFRQCAIFRGLTFKEQEPAA